MAALAIPTPKRTGAPYTQSQKIRPFTASDPWGLGVSLPFSFDHPRLSIRTIVWANNLHDFSRPSYRERQAPAVVKRTPPGSSSPQIDPVPATANVTSKASIALLFPSVHTPWLSGTPVPSGLPFPSPRRCFYPHNELLFSERGTVSQRALVALIPDHSSFDNQLLPTCSLAGSASVESLSKVDVFSNIPPSDRGLFFLFQQHRPSLPSPFLDRTPGRENDGTPRLPLFLTPDFPPVRLFSSSVFLRSLELRSPNRSQLPCAVFPVGFPSTGTVSAFFNTPKFDCFHPF